MNDHHRLLDAGAIFLAGVTGFSFWQHVSVAITILVGLGSLSLIILRWHDRVRYGPPSKGYIDE